MTRFAVTPLPGVTTGPPAMTADSGAAAVEFGRARSAVVPSGQRFAVDRRLVLDGYAATKMRTGARGTPLLPRQPSEKRRRGLGVEPMTCALNAFRAGD